MKKFFVTLFSALFLFLIIIYFSNFSQTGETSKSLYPFQEFKLKVPEPSGLYFDSKTNTLWTVSDENSTIYQLDSTAQIINKIFVNGKDLEGITFVNDSLLAVILERERTVVLLNNAGKEINRFKLNLIGEPNKGIEGISFNSDSGTFYVINEKKPRLLLEIDITGQETNTFNLDLATDFSGLSYENKENHLWIISDENQSILECTLSGKLINKYSVDIEQIEGIAIDSENKILYLVSDPEEKLYKFHLP